MAGSEWESFYQDLSESFGVDIDPTSYATGTESVFDAVAASGSLLTFVGENSRVALPGATDLVRLPVTAPVPVYPWSLVWRSRSRHPATRRLVARARRGFKPPRAGSAWLPRQARDDLSSRP